MAVKEKEQSSIITQEEIDIKCKSIQKSSHRLQSIIRNCNSPKFNNLDKYLSFLSNDFVKENNYGKNISRTKIYKQGSIIFVNFGTNLGSEFSGNHLAIVLNKNDNDKNQCLTVVPLTSKPKGNYNLRKNLINNIFSTLQKELETHKKACAEYSDIIQSLENPIEGKSKISISEETIHYLIKSSSTITQYENGNNTHTFEIEKALIQNEVMLKKIHEFYKAFDKNTYAKITSLITIDKKRILKPINALDPIGTTIIDKNSFTKIIIEIIKSFAELEVEVA